MTITDSPTSPVDIIRQALQTDFIDVFRQRMDVLRPASREDAYDMVMNQPQLLSSCFSLFRGNPDHFRHLMLDDKGQPADFTRSDDVLLKCGRTLADSIALVVRSATKRYFRRHVGIRLGAQPDTLSRKRADQLYSAIAEFIRFDWQSRLIPAYARLNVAIVNVLRERLLEFREPAEVIGLTTNPNALSAGQPPLLCDTARRAFTPRSGSLNPETVWLVCQQMDLGRLYSATDAKDLMTFSAQISMAEPDALNLMFPALGQSLRHFCMFLFVVHAEFGYARYHSVYGTGGQRHTIQRWMERLAKRPFPPPDFNAMRDTFREVILDGATFY